MGFLLKICCVVCVLKCVNIELFFGCLVSDVLIILLFLLIKLIFIVVRFFSFLVIWFVILNFIKLYVIVWGVWIGNKMIW